jgi:hypothetical protein
MFMSDKFYKKVSFKDFQYEAKLKHSISVGEVVQQPVCIEHVL